MNLSEQKIREITIEVIKELGDEAPPEKIRENVYRKVETLMSNGNFAQEPMDSGRVIITSYGINQPGVVSKISSVLAENDCDIQDITQKILQEFFTMIMIVDISSTKKTFKEISDLLSKVAEEMNIRIFIQHEDVFRYMHRL
ncbi:MAG: ACT domain-containing protein [Bacteroidetes bacterium]|nr:ACT domain-containing protein [Bacteroidota bacterium]MBU2586235.1 ACT domain-containing protein [Bacteroidota bacterium]